MSKRLEIDAKKEREASSGLACLYDVGLDENYWIPNSLCEDRGNDKLEVDVWWLDLNIPELL